MIVATVPLYNIIAVIVLSLSEEPKRGVLRKELIYKQVEIYFAIRLFWELVPECYGPCSESAACHTAEVTGNWEPLRHRSG